MRTHYYLGVFLAAFALFGCAAQQGPKAIIGYYSTGIVPVESSASFRISPEFIGRIGVKYWIKLGSHGRYESGHQLYFYGQPSGDERFSALGLDPKIPYYALRGGSKGSWKLANGRLILVSDLPVYSTIVPTNFSAEGKSEALAVQNGGAWTITWGHNELLRSSQPNYSSEPTLGAFH